MEVERQNLRRQLELEPVDERGRKELEILGNLSPKTMKKLKWRVRKLEEKNARDKELVVPIQKLPAELLNSIRILLILYYQQFSVPPHH
jgi:hypothetical protein